MVSFAGFKLEEGSPIYQQIILFFKRGLVSGSIQNGEELASRRMLSTLLGVNPNTVQKAYAALEEEGLIRSHTGAKSEVLLESSTLTRLRSELLREDVATLIRAMRQSGVSKEQALGMIEEQWEEIK